MSDTEFREGDLVEASKPDGSKLTGRLVARGDGNLSLGCINWTFPSWIIQNAGFSAITLIERAAPKVTLPTEIGWYLNSDGMPWYRQSTGANDGHHWKDEESALFSDDVAARYAPFTRLEPATDTAKRVLDAMGAWINGGYLINPDPLSALREQFGVPNA